ncbi:MAG TPA: gamma-glutamyltransferase, partial [Methylomirabilota bacterium]|nr:gamma-glutamyltransferase [Methylomirabilota bacterium]
MVASPHALASEAGVAILRAGGSAVDAAIAAAAVLSVVYPHMTSLGGDAFWLIHDGRTGAVRSLEAAGRAAAGATLDWFAGRGLREIPVRGIVPATLTVPGAVDGWCEAHARHGRLPLADDLAAAVGYARDGFPITRRLSEWIERSAPVLAADPPAARIFLAEGPRPAVGRRLVNPDLARTLERLGAGRAGFYEGEVARHLAKLGGFFTGRDLAAQGAYWGEPISGTYRDLTIYETPAPTQGFTVLQMLGLLEPFELHRREFADP